MINETWSFYCKREVLQFFTPSLKFTIPGYFILPSNILKMMRMLKYCLLVQETLRLN